MSSTKNTVLSPVVLAGIATGRADRSLKDTIASAVKAVQAQGGDEAAITKLVDDYGTGWLAGAMHKTGTPAEAWIKAARALRDLKGKDAKVAANEKRTAAQETLCGSMRQAMKRLRDGLGLKAADARGGANNTGARSTAPSTPARPASPAPAAAPTSAPTQPVTPGIKTVGEFVAYLTIQAKAMRGTAAKAGKLCSPEALRAIAAFEQAVAKLGGK